jgi:hypothetical protein
MVREGLPGVKSQKNAGLMRPGIESRGYKTPACERLDCPRKRKTSLPACHTGLQGRPPERTGRLSLALGKLCTSIECATETIFAEDKMARTPCSWPTSGGAGAVIRRKLVRSLSTVGYSSGCARVRCLRCCPICWGFSRNCIGMPSSPSHLAQRASRHLCRASLGARHPALQGEGQPKRGECKNDERPLRRPGEENRIQQ